MLTRGNGLRRKRSSQSYIGTWRAYQSVLHQDTRRERQQKRRSKILLMILLLVGVIYIISGTPLIGTAYYNVPRKNTEEASANKSRFDKEDLRRLFSAKRFGNLKKPYLNVMLNNRHLHIKTTIDPDLQQSIMNVVNTNAYRYMGIVAMNPGNGKILSMVSYDRDNPDTNVCISNRFPAASIFKIVTAAAAIEKCGFNAESEINFVGGKHTLYKSQLRHAGGYGMSLRDSFAQSVNPVFGKIGVHYVGKKGLEKYAYAFGFNRMMNFDLPMQPSTLYMSADDQFQWAEVASGYNRDTVISAVHGAMIGSAVVNQGKLIEPILIDEVWDQHGNMLYQSSPRLINQAVSGYGAAVLKKLMEATIEAGTCRKSFHGYQNDSILSDLTIGGKTGTINSRSDGGYRFDWFVGFAEEKEGRKKLALSIVIAHDKFIGVKANQYAQIIFRSYFGDYINPPSVKPVIAPNHVVKAARAKKAALKPAVIAKSAAAKKIHLTKNVKHQPHKAVSKAKKKYASKS